MKSDRIVFIVTVAAVLLLGAGCFASCILVLVKVFCGAPVTWLVVALPYVATQLLVAVTYSLFLFASIRRL